jgi:hypothetical protein
MASSAVNRTFIVAALGIATSVAVSWWLALQTDLRGAPRSPQGAAEFRYESIVHNQVWIFNRHMTKGVLEISCAAMGPTQSDSDQKSASAAHQVTGQEIPSWSVMCLPASGPANHIEQAFGWPLLALSQRFQGELASDQWNHTRSIPVQPALEQFGPGAGLPVRIIPLGFVVNSVLYAWMWFALLAFPALVRRTLRRRRGACPHCGYDLRATHDGCPECGSSNR